MQIASAWGQTAQSSAIEQSRLFDRAALPGSNVNADGIALPDNAAADSSDDSFGAQQVLKNQERVRQWIVAGDATIFYTSNAALTRNDTISDGLAVVDGSLSWVPKIARDLELQVGIRTSIFRYFDTTELDFENLGAGVGLAWTPSDALGIAFFGRYDFTELIDTHSREILSDHEWTVGAQKTFVLGRSHALTLGVVGMAGISDPYSAQRDQVGGFIGYHLQLTRQVDADLLYRAGYFCYNQGNRKDWNEVVSASFTYHLNQWASLVAFLSFGDNRSNRSAFEYDVFSGGGGLAVNVHF
jgi:hypothetical protein